MIRALPLLLLLLAVPARAGEPAVEERASIAWELPAGTRWAGQALVLRLRVSYDRAWFEAHGVPLFARALDVPLAVDAAGLDAPDGRIALAALPPAAVRPRVRLAVNGGVEEAFVEPEGPEGQGGARVALVLERRLLLPRPGALDLPAPRLRFAFATSFAVDALGARVPVDRQEVVRDGAAARVAVLPVPLVDRPAGFTDAVGRFSVSAQAPVTDVVVGVPFRLRVTIAGVGNLERLTPPPLDRLGAFHLYGLTDDHGLVERTLVADLAATRADVAAIPAIALPHFDPDDARGFVSARSEPIALRVRPDPAMRVVAPPPASATPESSGALAVGLGAVLLLLLAGGIAWRVRARAHGAATGDDAGSVRLRSAVDVLNEIPVNEPRGLADAFVEVLAARLRVPGSAVIAADLAARLRSAAVGPETALEAALVLEALVGARYGAVAPDEGIRARAVAVAGRLRPPGP